MYSILFFPQITQWSKSYFLSSLAFPHLFKAASVLMIDVLQSSTGSAILYLFNFLLFRFPKTWFSV